MATDVRRPLTLTSVLTPWLVAATVAEYLSVGDLIQLARSCTALRATFHGFFSPDSPIPGRVRSSLQIGNHQTSGWRTLKSRATLGCVSVGHRSRQQHETRPCRLCSIPVCQACIVRVSFSKPLRRTYPDRVRYMCTDCWELGNPQRKRKFTTPQERQMTAYVDEGVCECTPREIWVCSTCQDEQEQGARKDVSTCFGDGCLEKLDVVKYKTSICIWCDKPVKLAQPRSAVEAIKRREESRAADLEEYNRKRLQQLRMSRRQLRGDAAVLSDPQADRPQFVRDLDTVNYERMVGRDHAPSPDAVYASRSGKFRYNRGFLLAFRDLISQKQPALRAATITSDQGYARSNMTKRLEQRERRSEGNRLAVHSGPPLHFKAQILQAHFVERLSLEDIQCKVREDYHHLFTVDQYRQWMLQWGYAPNEVIKSDAEQLEEAVNVQPFLSDEAMALKVQEELWAEDQSDNGDAESEDDEVLEMKAPISKRAAVTKPPQELDPEHNDDDEFVLVDQPNKRTKGNEEAESEEDDDAEFCDLGTQVGSAQLHT